MRFLQQVMTDATGQLRDGLIRLLAGAADPPRGPPLVSLEAAAAGYVEERLRFLSSADLALAAQRGQLEQAGISPQFLDIVGHGSEHLAGLAGQRPDAPAWYADVTLSPQVQDALTMLAERRKLSLSPFSGEWDWLGYSLGPGLFPLRHDDGRRCLVMQWHETCFPRQDTAWFFPDHDVVLVCADMGFPREVWPQLMNQTLQILLAVADVAADHLARPVSGSVLVAEPLIPHIGHYVWNAASGWDGVFRWADPEAIDAVAAFSKTANMGGVDGLYADRLAPRTEVIRYDDEARLARAAIERGALLAGCSNTHIAADYAARYLSWAEAEVDQSFRARRAALRAASDPLVLVTLRLDNRYWIEQAEGIVALVRALRQDHPRLGIVLDGMNHDFVSGWTHAFMSLDAERALAAQIMDGIGRDDRVFDSIGCSVAESLALASACDLFVAPIGAGMAKYRWIANLPGVAFSNSAWLQPNEFNGRLYDFFREGARVAEYLEPDEVADVGGDRGIGRANFSLDWRRLHARVSDFLARRTAGSA